jgi:DNA polymerase-3 subunit delta'
MQKNGSSPDLYIIDNDESSIGVDEIRDMQSDIAVKPAYSKRKVYIIANCDKMTVQAQNCLLKTLEEPPQYATIMLTASNMGTILETIHSRTIHYNLKRNTYDEVLGFLKSSYGGGLKNSEFIAVFADGVIGLAKETAESDDFLLLREKAIELIMKLSSKKMPEIFTACDFFDKNKTSADNILNMMLLFYRDLLIAKVSREENMLINSDKKDIIINNVGVFSVRGLLNSIELIEQTKLNLKKNANFQLSIEVMLMKLQEECS